MDFKKPFRAEPVVLGEYQITKLRNARRKHIIFLSGIGFVVGAALGLALLFSNTDRGRQAAASTRSIAADWGLVRRNDPKPGDYFRSCEEARSAGVAPLSIGEAGYRNSLDLDGDGVACEPYVGAR